MFFTPLVSVLIPVFNSEEGVRSTLESIKLQTFQDFEAVLVNDGSTDRSIEIAKDIYPEARILNQSNQGIAKALNNGLQICRGEYIARIDCNDTAYPSRLEHQVSALDKDPTLGVIGGHVMLYEANGEDLGVVKYPTTPKDVVIALKRKSSGLLHEATMIRKSFLIQAGGYDPFFNGREDSELWCRLSLISKLNNLDEVVVRSLSTISGISFKGLNLSPLLDLALLEREERKIYGIQWKNSAERAKTAQKIQAQSSVKQSRWQQTKSRSLIYRRRATFLFRSGERLPARREYLRAINNFPFDIIAWLGFLTTFLLPFSVFWKIYRIYRNFAVRGTANEQD